MVGDLLELGGGWIPGRCDPGTHRYPIDSFCKSRAGAPLILGEHMEAVSARNAGHRQFKHQHKDGSQPGAPGLGAQAIRGGSGFKHPLVHLLLGSDALRRARERLDNVIEEIQRREAVTRSTDFPQGA